MKETETRHDFRIVRGPAEKAGERVTLPIVVFAHIALGLPNDVLDANIPRKKCVRKSTPVRRR